MDKTAVIWALVILFGGCLIFWLQVLLVRAEANDSEEAQYSGLFALPWLFGATAAGAYVYLWFVRGDAPIASMSWWAVAICIVVGAVLGFVIGVVGLITDPGIEPNIRDQIETTLVYLSLPFGVVLGTSWAYIWKVPGPMAGFCIGPLIMLGALWLLGFMYKFVDSRA